MLGAFLKFVADLFSPAQQEREHGGDVSKCPFMNPGLVAGTIPALPPPEPESQITENSLVYPEFDKALDRFNPNTDIMVLSEEYIKDFDQIYQAKLRNLGNKVIIFPKGTLVERNVALVTAGYSSYNSSYGIKKI